MEAPVQLQRAAFVSVGGPDSHVQKVATYIFVLSLQNFTSIVLASELLHFAQERKMVSVEHKISYLPGSSYH